MFCTALPTVSVALWANWGIFSAASWAVCFTFSIKSLLRRVIFCPIYPYSQANYGLRLFRLKLLLILRLQTLYEAQYVLASESNSATKGKSTTAHLPSMPPSNEKDEKAKLLELAEEVAHFGSWEWDITKPRAVWSPEMFRIFGIEPQAEGLSLEEFCSFIHPDDLEMDTKRIQAAHTSPKLNQKSSLDYRIIRGDGAVRIIHSQRQIKELTQDGKLRVVVGVDQDVTEQRIAQHASAETTKLLALAEEVAHFGSWEWDITKPLATWSPGMFKVFGVEPRTKGFTWEEYASFIHPDDREAAIKNAQIMMDSPLNHRETFDYRIICPDSTVRILHAQRQVKEVDAQGKAKVVVGVDQDVTEQRKAEEALKKSEERFRVVAEAANVGVYEIELNTRQIHFMSDLERLTGYKPQETNWKLDWVIEHLHPDDRDCIKTKWKRVISDPKLDHYVLEYRFLHKNGQYITLKDTARILKDAQGKSVLVIGGVRDITQRKRDQEKIHQYSKHLEQLVAERTKQLVEMERLAAMGQVAGMVGHDIRNPLQALTGEIYLIRSELDSIVETEAKANIINSLDSVDEEISYINKIVADLQDYSRALRPEMKEVNLDALIAEVFSAVKVPDKIHLSISVKSAPKVNADPTFLRRALTNLINNAIQAMPQGGNLEVAGYQENNHVCITIADTGVGIDDALKTKVFTPLFTTKAKGQGLGLAVVKRLVEAQGGSICFESNLNKGTKFWVKLPLNRDET